MATKHKRSGDFFKVLKPYVCAALVHIRGNQSRETLAKSAGMDAGTLRRVEKGESPPREEYIFGILRALDITLPKFMRIVADFYEKEGREVGLLGQMSTEELFHEKRKAYEDWARLKRQALEIEIEIERRQIPSDPSDRGKPSQAERASRSVNRSSGTTNRKPS